MEKIGRCNVFMETYRALRSTSYKAAEDITRNDQVCEGVCLVTSACQVVGGGLCSN
jgi:hypothetical protein